MVLNEHQYQGICEELSKCIITNTQLERLKNHFRDKIDSKRTLSYIGSFQGLIRILEKRDILSHEYEDVLKEIINLVAPDNIKIERLFPINSLANQQPSEPRVLGSVPTSSIERVHLIIRHEIGGKWKEFARFLNIPEGDIDKLDSQHRGNIPDMVQEILVLHQTTYSNIDMWKLKLREALDNARRKDLARKIDRILIEFV